MAMARNTPSTGFRMNGQIGFRMPGRKTAKPLMLLAGAEGFEPSHGGIKIPRSNNEINGRSENSCYVPVMGNQTLTAAFVMTIAAIAATIAPSAGAQTVGSWPTIHVIDADTVEQAGIRWRLVGLDAPEIGTAKCPEERRQGLLAAARLIALLTEHGGVLVPATGRGRDKYGRRLGKLFLGGQDWAGLAVSERHAVAWNGQGRRHDWCASH